MQPKTLFAACLFGAAVTAFPGRKPLKGKAVHVNANFDDLIAAPLGVNPVGDYKYLEYSGFSVGSEYLVGVQLFGVKPHSPPNVAYSNVITNTFTGPSLLADYDGSNTKKFDLSCFYYACVGVDANQGTVAENCTITVTGYASGTQVATQTFTYDQDNLLSLDLDATMEKATLSSDFKGLTEVDFTYTNTENIDTPPAFIADNFLYTAYLTK